MDKFSYAFGLNIGKQLKSMGVGPVLDLTEFTTAISDIFNNHTIDMSENEMNQIINDKMVVIQQQKAKTMREDGEKFLAENKNRDGIQVTKSGLQYEVIRVGTGATPGPTDKVRCHYEGTFIDGTVFDSSYKRNQPADFGLNQVIPGWTEGLQLMSEGAKYRFYIPWSLGYGAQGAPNAIPPYSTLIFDVELIRIVK